LTASDIAVALRGLTEAERAELLALLSDAEVEQASLPEDDRPSISSFLEEIRREHALRTADPAAWLVADEAHKAAVERHMQRLLAGVAPGDDISSWFHAWSAARQEAAKLAAEEGHPPPGADGPDAAEAVEADDAELDGDATDGPTLPLATQRDVQYARAVQRAARPGAPTPADAAADRMLRDDEVRNAWAGAFPSRRDPAVHSDGV
jgi:hypothetical protein